MKAEKLLKEALGATSKEDKPIPTSYFENENFIYEQINSGTFATDATDATVSRGRSYVKYNKQTGEIDEVEDFYDGDKRYVPIDTELTENINLPSGVEEYGDIDNLITKIKDYYNYNFQVPKEYEMFLPFLCLFTWVYERFPNVPYLNFVGLTGTGKTTAMEVFGTLCYKTLDVSGSITMASIFRTTTVWKGTLLLDEFDNVGEEARAMISFLKSGFGNRSVLRVEGERVREVKAYRVKCPKIFTSEKPITDAGLQSRTIVIPMEKNKRPIPLYRLNKFKKDGEQIKNMLLLWRLRNLNKINLEELEFGFEELQAFDARVQQVITPIYYLADEKARKSILEFAKEQQLETFRQRREAQDGIIFNKIYEMVESGENLLLDDITAHFNHTAKPYKDWNNNKTANVIRKILGMETSREGHENTTIVVYQKNKFEELCVYYGLPIPPETVASVASVAKDEQEEFLDKFEEVV